MDRSLLVCAVHMALTLPCLYTVVPRNSMASIGLYCMPFTCRCIGAPTCESVVGFKRINGTLTNQFKRLAH